MQTNKNRADTWSRSTRLYLPIGEDTIGSANSVPQNTGTVNVHVSSFSANDSAHDVLITSNEGANNAVQPTVRPNESSVALGGAKAPSVTPYTKKPLISSKNMGDSKDGFI